MDLFIYLKKKENRISNRKKKYKKIENDAEAFTWFNCWAFSLFFFTILFPIYKLVSSNFCCKVERHTQQKNKGGRCSIFFLNRWFLWHHVLSNLNKFHYSNDKTDLVRASQCYARNCMEKMRCSLNTSSNSIRNVDSTCDGHLSAHTRKKEKKKKDPSSKKKKKKKSRGTPSLDVWSIRDEPSSLRKEKNVPSGYS